MIRVYIITNYPVRVRWRGRETTIIIFLGTANEESALRVVVRFGNNSKNCAFYFHCRTSCLCSTPPDNCFLRTPISTRPYMTCTVYNAPPCRPYIIISIYIIITMHACTYLFNTACLYSPNNQSYARSSTGHCCYDCASAVRSLGKPRTFQIMKIRYLSPQQRCRRSVRMINQKKKKQN